jgi:hypothetical protein
MTTTGHYLILTILIFSIAPVLAESSDGQPLLEAAAKGEMQKISVILGAGILPDVKNAQGDTALHLAVTHGHQATAELLLSKGAAINITNRAGMTPLDVARIRGHSSMAAFLVGRGAVSALPRGPAVSSDGKRGFHPDAPFTTAEAFSRAIGLPAVLLDSKDVSILAPKSREQAAAIVLPYLVRAYEELYRIVGVHTKYKLLVYAYPKGTPGVRGGTSGCVIKYTDENLDLASQSEWLQHRVPHVSGYIEEMAHNFVHATGAEFGWEMIGWTLSVKVCDLVASNPIYRRQVAETQRGQDNTWQRYIAGGHTFPPDLPADQADRLHAYLLRKCEQQYGPQFWPHFFAEVRKMNAAFSAPEAQGESSGLDVRYRLTVDCFDHLPGLSFKKLLDQNGISTTSAVQSFKPTNPGWNRKLR